MLCYTYIASRVMTFKTKYKMDTSPHSSPVNNSWCAPA
jgi:hypothetical protein